MSEKVKVRPIEDFYDRENDLKLRTPKETFEVDRKRADTLVSKGLVEEVKEAEVPKGLENHTETKNVAKK